MRCHNSEVKRSVLARRMMGYNLCRKVLVYGQQTVALDLLAKVLCQTLYNYCIPSPLEDYGIECKVMGLFILPR